MKTFIFLIALALSLAGCGDGTPSTPELEGMYVTDSFVVAGSNVTTSVTFRVEAVKVGGEYISEPLSLVVNLPIGATYVTGSSNIGFQGARAPDEIVSCLDGGVSLVFNILRGEIADPFSFDSFSSVIGFDVTLGVLANEREAQAASSLLPVANPCIGPFTDEVTYRVEAA